VGANFVKDSELARSVICAVVATFEITPRSVWFRGILDCIKRPSLATRCHVRTDFFYNAEPARGYICATLALTEIIPSAIWFRDSLNIGLRSAAESQQKLKEYPNWSRLKKFFIDKSADQNHKFEIVNSLKKGYRMGLDRIDEALQQLGVNEIVCQGKPFDPRIMNAVDIEETGDVPDGTVLEVYRTGYMIDTDVFQPAQVKVARAAG
jgi:hypothetical protein